jgi:HlyD family secretion protein
MSEEKVILKPVVSNIKKKKARKKKVLWIIIIAVILLIVISVVVSNKKEKITDVQTEKVSRQNITQIVTATGKIQSETTVNISSEVSGEIIELPFKEGDEVKKGDLVVKIKQDAYDPQIKQQSALIKVQESNLKTQEVNLKKYQLDLNRAKELNSKGLSSSSDLETAQTNVDATLAQMNTIRAQISQQKAALASVEYDLTKTTIYSPMSGNVTKLNNEKGERVLGTGYNIGSEILTISDLSKMEAQVDVGETDVSMINIGDTAKIQVDAFSDKVFTGYVYEIANTATTKSSGTQEEVVNFVVKIRIVNEGLELRPGMSCSVDIEVEKKENVLAVPIQSVTTRDNDSVSSVKTNSDNTESSENAVTTKESKTVKKVKAKEIVFVVENGVAKVKEVKTGISNDTYIEIKEGLEEGTEIVKGSFKAINKELDEGSKVKVDNEKKKKITKDKE